MVAMSDQVGRQIALAERLRFVSIAGQEVEVDQSRPRVRKYVHQHQFGSPPSSNRLARSGKRSGVSGRTSTPLAEAWDPPVVVFGRFDPLVGTLGNGICDSLD